MRRFSGLFVLSATVVSFGCSSSTSGDPGEACSDNSQCIAGSICSGGECAQLCSQNNDCPTDLVCSGSGVCESVPGGRVPSISRVEGNDPAGATQILDGVVIVGDGLGDVAIEMATASTTIELLIRSQAVTQVEVILPVDVTSGDYTLVARNAAGADQTTVTLTLPELDGDELVTRINDAATTGVISMTRIEPGFQRRVSGTCGSGGVGAINADGTVACNPDAVLAESDVEGFVANDVTAGTIPFSDGSVLGDTPLRYDGATNVGIGVTNPTERFVVTTGGFAYNQSAAPNSNSTPRCDCDLDPEFADCSDPFTTNTFIAGRCYDWWSTTAGSGMDAENEFVTVDAPDFTVTGSGDVSIGVQSPSARLHVGGDVRIDGEVRFGDRVEGSGYRELTTDLMVNNPIDMPDSWIVARVRCSGHWGSYMAEIDLVTRYYRPAVRRYYYICGNGNHTSGGALVERTGMHSGFDGGGLPTLTLQNLGDSSFDHSGIDMYDATITLNHPPYVQSYMRIRTYGGWPSRPAGTALSDTTPFVVWETWN